MTIKDLEKSGINIQKYNIVYKTDYEFNFINILLDTNFDKLKYLIDKMEAEDLDYDEVFILPSGFNLITTILSDKIFEEIDSTFHIYSKDIFKDLTITAIEASNNNLIISVSYDK
ncbi:MAG: hypothetical protein IJZ36_03600 [Bacilli bacterium]|nr:hypothetical protein [Bacilli bacterium]